LRGRVVKLGENFKACTVSARRNDKVEYISVRERFRDKILGNVFRRARPFREPDPVFAARI
jgi:hypothetical protein